jgi:hypothetical protein
MRSAEPIPGEAWPHAMTITVDDRPDALLDLLWIREAHQLQPEGDDLPPLLVDPPLAVSDSAVTAEMRAEWEEDWARIWHAVAAHAGLESDPHQFEQMRNTADGSPERADLLRRSTGPTWRYEYGDSAFADPSYDIWVQDGFDAHRSSIPNKLQDSPERRDLAALIPAWRAGLTKIVTIPCRGEFTRKISPNALLMTDEIHHDSDAYQRALATFN